MNIVGKRFSRGLAGRPVLILRESIAVFIIAGILVMEIFFSAELAFLHISNTWISTTLVVLLSLHPHRRGSIAIFLRQGFYSLFHRAFTWDLLTAADKLPKPPRRFVYHRLAAQALRLSNEPDVIAGNLFGMFFVELPGRKFYAGLENERVLGYGRADLLGDEPEVALRCFNCAQYIVREISAKLLICPSCSPASIDEDGLPAFTDTLPTFTLAGFITFWEVELNVAGAEPLEAVMAAVEVENRLWQLHQKWLSLPRRAKKVKK